MTSRPNPDPPPPARVEISAAGHQVVVEAAATLAVVKKAALDLFRATDSPDVTRAAGAMGFIGERADSGGGYPTEPCPPDERRRRTRS